MWSILNHYVNHDFQHGDFPLMSLNDLGTIGHWYPGYPVYPGYQAQDINKMFVYRV